MDSTKTSNFVGVLGGTKPVVNFKCSEWEKIGYSNVSGYARGTIMPPQGLNLVEPAVAESVS